MDVGNILPDQEAIIEITLTTALSIEGGAYCLRIPTSYFPKYRNNS